MSRQVRKKLFAVGRTVFGLGLLAFVVSRVDLNGLLAALNDVDWRFVVAALALQSLATVLRTVRWGDLLLAASHARRFPDLLAWLFIGLFFNSFLPTGIGGDLVRGYYTSRGGDGSLIKSYAVLAVERALGLISLTSVASLAAIVTLARGGDPLPGRTLWLVAFAGTAMTAVGITSFAWQGWLDPLRRLDWLGGRVARMIAGIGAALELFRRPETRRLRIVVISFALLVIAVLFHVACARAVGLGTPLPVFCLIVPASIVASMIPLSLNGLGLREGALVGLLLAYGADSTLAAAFALLALLIATVFPLVGGVIYAFHRTGPAES